MQLTPAPLTILASPCSAEHQVKKSVFVAIAEPLGSPDAAGQLLASHRDPDARHHCWAWRCNGDYRFSDDGEPAGTAGRPILQAVEGAGLERTLVIVRRYFGGIKLGAGGLVRAYSAATTACLANAQTRQLTPHVHLHLQAPFSCTQALFSALAGYAASDPVHSSQGISLTAWVAAAECDPLLANLRNITRGQIQARRGDIELR